MGVAGRPPSHRCPVFLIEIDEASKLYLPGPSSASFVLTVAGCGLGELIRRTAGHSFCCGPLWQDARKMGLVKRLISDCKHFQQ